MRTYYLPAEEDIPLPQTYDEASQRARELAQTGRTTVIYKVVPVARFEAAVTVTEHELAPEGG